MFSDALEYFFNSHNYLTFNGIPLSTKKFHV